MSPRHFLTLKDLSSDELKQLLIRASELKKIHREGTLFQPLTGRVLAMIFEKSSTRTRVSFEAGMAQFGGHALFLSSRDTQLGRGEPVEDSARVISSMVDAVMIRTFDHETVETFAKYSSVPVINALTDDYHPCQLLADMQTYQEHRGSIEGKKVVWVGDGNNMCNSYINAAALLNFQLVVACPVGYEPNAELVAEHKDRVTVLHDAHEAAPGFGPSVGGPANACAFDSQSRAGSPTISRSTSSGWRRWVTTRQKSSAGPRTVESASAGPHVQVSPDGASSAT